MANKLCLLVTHVHIKYLEKLTTANLLKLISQKAIIIIIIIIIIILTNVLRVLINNLFKESFY